MKNVFGNIITRTVGSGVNLTPIEKELLELLPEYLRPDIAEIVVQQVDMCNLVQREVDGRALNFYRKQKGKVNKDAMPKLKTKKIETRLLSITFEIEGGKKEFHVSYNAVNGIFFCMNFSADLRPYKNISKINVIKISKSWRSNLIPWKV